MEGSIYNLDYFEGYLRNCSRSAEDIAKIRWSFVKETKARTVLDYGSGVGWFRAFRPKDKRVDTYDIGEYPQTGINRKRYDLICLWDVLEHIPNFNSIGSLLSNARFVAITVPIKPKGVKLETWKHFKPGEHLHYFTLKTLDLFFKKYGYHRIKYGNPECPPRQDVTSVLYGK